MIRTVRVSDADSIAAIIVNAWQTAYAGVIDPAYPQTLRREKFADLFRTIIGENRETVFVYERAVRIVGFISGTLRSDQYDAQVIGLYIDPAHQGQGLGRSLLGRMKAHFRSLHCESMCLVTLRGARNNAFYVKNGGTEKERTDIEIGGRGYPGVVYRFDLGDPDETRPRRQH